MGRDLMSEEINLIKELIIKLDSKVDRIIEMSTKNESCNKWNSRQIAAIWFILFTSAAGFLKLILEVRT